MQQRAEKTRAAILAAARRHFAARGFAGTTVDVIAAGAGVNKQRIYAYFGSKRRLFEQILLDLFAESEAEFERFADRAEPDGEDLTAALWRHFTDLHRRKPEFQRLLTWANLEEAVDPAALASVRSHENSRLRRWFAQEAAAGRIRADIAFESWLLTLMGVAYFCNSNFRTLSRTLGESCLDDAGRIRLGADLGVVFSGIRRMGVSPGLSGCGV